MTIPSAVQAQLSRKTVARTCVVLALLAAGAVSAVWLGSRQREDAAIAMALTGGDPTRAPALIRRYGCGGCHTISAVGGADGTVAAPLDRFRSRVYIGGVLQNSPQNLVRWIVSPRTFSPRTAMPNTGISEADAQDIAAFLYAH
jgi:cytochrome c2